MSDSLSTDTNGAHSLPVSEPVHTDCTATTTTIHTGLTPTEDVFGISSIPLELSPSAEAAFLESLPSPTNLFDPTTEPESLEDLSFDDLFANAAPFDPSLPSTGYELTVQTNASIQQGARRNSIEDVLDPSLVAVPTNFEEVLTYGKIVGPSKGLHSEHLQDALISNSLLQETGPSYPLSVAAEAPFDFSAAQYGAYDNHAQPAPGNNFPYYTTMTVSDPFIDSQAVDMSFARDLNNLAGYDASLAPTGQQVYTGFETAAQRKESSATDATSHSPPPGVEKKIAPVKADRKRLNEQPKRPADKPWVRVNNGTKGLNSRTGKINNYDPAQWYSKIEHPTGEWTTSTGHVFSYNQWHEMRDHSLSAAQLKEFIYEHPYIKKHCKMTLFIQRAPADSKRRYPTSSLDQCRFKECPMRVYGKSGTFMHGHFRVALDELSYKHSDFESNDPFQVAGYVHLFCFERFLDLPGICRLKHIRVQGDDRQISKEPKGSFAAALNGVESRAVKNFIDAACDDHIHDRAEWATYPSQPCYLRASEADQEAGFQMHRGTLNYALQRCRNEGRGSRVMSKLQPSNVAIHRGDLVMYNLARRGRLDEADAARIIAEVAQIDEAQRRLSGAGLKKRRRSTVTVLAEDGSRKRSKA